MHNQCVFVVLGVPGTIAKNTKIILLIALHFQRHKVEDNEKADKGRFSGRLKIVIFS